LGANATSGGLIALLSNFVAGAGLQDVRNIVDGLEGIMDSYQDHNPLLNLIADGLKVLLDIGTLAAMPFGLKAVTQANNIRSTLQITRFIGAIGQYLKGGSVDFSKYVGPAASAISTLSASISAAGQLASDGIQLWSDWNAYQEYAQTHY
jgi:hypothetical protein